MNLPPTETSASRTLRARISLGLVHWPILDRRGQVVATNVTNFDIHDIARACRTYGLENYYIINRVKEQLMFVSRVLDHWQVGQGSQYNPMRKTALGMVRLAETVEEAIKNWDCDPLIVATTARSLESPPRISFRELRTRLIEDPKRPVFLVFGTGFGLHSDVLSRAHFLLEPIRGASPDDYRHLSVRSAVSICLDRLLGEW